MRRQSGYRRPRWLHLSVLIALVFCTFAYAAPEIKIGSDRAAETISIWKGTPIDLVVTIDPAGGSIPLDGLVARVELDPADAGELGEAVLPPPDTDGAYRQPFEVRVPLTPLKEGAFAVNVTLESRSGQASGNANLAIFPPPPPSDDGMGGMMPFEEGGETEKVSATATLKTSPAKAGEPNAVVVKVKVGEGWHIYGKQVDIGVPTTADLLPAGPERLWVDGERAVPDGDQLHGEFTIEIPFTPLKAGEVATRVSLLYMACTEEICDPVSLTYLPISFAVEAGDQGQIAAAEAESDAQRADQGGVGGKDMTALIIGAILSGLLALAMPCTYPMIPITFSFFTKQAEKRGGNVLSLSIAYGLGIVGLFVFVGVGLSTVIIDVVNHWVTNTIIGFI